MTRSPRTPLLLLLALSWGCRDAPQTPAALDDNANSGGGSGANATMPRVVEQIDRNRLRVAAFAFGGVEVGQCADASGALRPGSCVTPQAPPSQAANAAAARIRPDSAASQAASNSASDGASDDSADALAMPVAASEQAASEQAANELGADGAAQPLRVASADLARLRPADLNAGVFREYARTLDINVSGKAAVGGVEADTSNTYKRYQIIYEWRRFTLIELPGSPRYRADTPHVISLEAGFAIRMVISVTSLDVTASGKAALGLADLEASLALGQSEVSVGYDITGTNHSLLHGTPVTVRTTQELWDALERFHGAVRLLETSWHCAQRPDQNDPAACCSSGESADKDAPVLVNCPMDNHFAVLAYYVHGDDIGTIYANFEHGRQDCYDDAFAAAQHSTLTAVQRQQAQQRLDGCLLRVSENYEQAIHAANNRAPQPQAPAATTPAPTP